MAILQVSLGGQIILPPDMLEHLGIRPGARIDLTKLQDGRAILQAWRPTGTIEGFIGLLADKTTKTASTEEISRAAEAGWAKE